MFFISDEILDRTIAEDVPYFDLTTWSLDIGEHEGEMEYFSREDIILCGTEEVLRIFDRFSVHTVDSKPSGTFIKAGEVFIKAEGKAGNLHMAWKVCQNILDHCSAISTATSRLLSKARSVNPNIMVVTTRKGFPGTKALSMKAVLTGGAFPHRLGLSETVLVFKQHMNFIGGMDGFIKEIPSLKIKISEKKLIVEADCIEDGIRLCKGGVDGIQFDKLSPGQLKEGTDKLKAINPHITLLAAGGINEKNIEEYAGTGVDAIVTTSLYSAPPVDIGVRIRKIL